MKRTLHGLSRKPEYAIWCGMKTRCYNKNFRFYSYYGGRGIAVCDRWLESFSNFYKDMGSRPPGTSIDRKDNNLGYSPENCVWATKKEQGANRRGRHLITAMGETKAMGEWANLSGLSVETIWWRINSGWDATEAVTFKVGEAGYGLQRKARLHAAAAREVVVYPENAAEAARTGRQPG